MRAIKPDHTDRSLFLLFALVLALASLGLGDSTLQGLARADTRTSQSLSGSDQIHGFGILPDGIGWLSIGQQVYGTADNSLTWLDISPPGLANARIMDVHFNSSGVGRVLWSIQQADGSQELWISTSGQASGGWDQNPVARFSPADPGYEPAEAGMFWLNDSLGWVSVTYRSSSSVSTGALYRTVDGGQAWMGSTLPVGADVAFASRDIGWVAGGAGGDELYRSPDGGQTWRAENLPGLNASIIHTYLPFFEDDQAGLLPVLVHDGNQYHMKFLESRDGGLSWAVLVEIPLGNSVNLAGLQVQVLDASQAVVLDPAGWLYVLADRKVTSQPVERSILDGSLKLAMLNTKQGWLQSSVQNCLKLSGPSEVIGGKGSFNCSRSTRLFQTADGGLSWGQLELPAGRGASIQHSYQVTPFISTDAFTIQSNELRITTQGFDACVPATVSQLQDWWNNSPYYAMNIYIGGANRGCNSLNQAAITKSFIAQVRSQGWYFIPTWVGLQASCSSGNFWKMSSNASTAYSQGVNEANDAADVMAALGFTGSIIYFDLEYYNMADAACVNAARSFVNGWTVQLHNRGYLSGLYASAYKVDNYYTISNRPDGIWMAGGGPNYTSYNPSATVWGNRYVSDDLWNDTRRIFQYTSGHNETWGSTTLNIDCDAVNGIVAVPGTSVNCPAPALVSPADGFVSSSQTVNFSWTAPTGCTFNGYTFRIKDVSNMEQGGTLILDTSTTPASFSAAIPSAWKDKDLFWGVRTNFPYSPNWAVRKFRIASSPACTITNDQVGLFSGLNYVGTCVVKGVGDYPNAGAMGIANDDISSVMVGANVHLKLCQGDALSGVCESFNGNDPDLSNNSIGDNQASSASVKLKEISATLFADAGFGGASCQLQGTGWSNACSGMDNQASSLRILSGWSARLWSGTDLKGESRCFNADTSSFSGLSFNENGTSSLDNAVSSFAAYHQASCPPLLTIQVTGSGTGTITSTPSGINCGDSCSAAFADGSSVTLKAAASSGSAFTGWSGDCSGTGDCQVTMSAARSVSANFIPSTFVDVPFDYSETLGGVTYYLHDYIQTLYDHGMTAGTHIDPPKYSPAMQLDRAMTAVFLLRAHLGTSYLPPGGPFDAFVLDDWTLNDWARPWAEDLWDKGLTAGCQAPGDPLIYCPDQTLPRVQAIIFGLRMKYDYLDGEGKLVQYQPPPATGLVFADMTDVDYYGTAWAEQAYLDGLLPICGESGGKPLFCPEDPVNRAWAAYIMVQAKGLLGP